MSGGWDPPPLHLAGRVCREEGGWMGGGLQGVCGLGRGGDLCGVLDDDDAAVAQERGRLSPPPPTHTNTAISKGPPPPPAAAS